MTSRKRARPNARKANARTFELRFPSILKNIGRVEAFLRDIGTTLNIDDGTMYRVYIATTEAANNAILHGNKSDPDKEVLMICRATKSSLSIRVRDEGVGFDAEALPNPLDEKNLMKEHGRGVFLIRSMMDDVRFRRLKTGSVVHMRVRLER